MPATPPGLIQGRSLVSISCATWAPARFRVTTNPSARRSALQPSLHGPAGKGPRTAREASALTPARSGPAAGEPGLHRGPGRWSGYRGPATGPHNAGPPSWPPGSCPIRPRSDYQPRLRAAAGTSPAPSRVGSGDSGSLRRSTRARPAAAERLAAAGRPAAGWSTAIALGGGGPLASSWATALDHWPPSGTPPPAALPRPAPRPSAVPPLRAPPPPPPLRTAFRRRCEPGQMAWG